MKKTEGPIEFTLDASNAGEIVAVAEELAKLPPDTFVTFGAPVELKMGQIGSRVLKVYAWPGRRDVTKAPKN